jgi:hypothetical protein
MTGGRWWRMARVFPQLVGYFLTPYPDNFWYVYTYTVYIYIISDQSTAGPSITSMKLMDDGRLGGFRTRPNMKLSAGFVEKMGPELSQRSQHGTLQYSVPIHTWTCEKIENLGWN